MSREKEFDNILDECLDRIMFEGQTIEQCLGDYPEYADELQPLLEASVVTSRISSLEPRPEFRESARKELFSILRESEEKKSRSFFSFRGQPRWVTVVVVAVILLIATGGTASASTGSMPGDFLYPVKRATEEIQLAFTFTNLGKAEAYARMANRRIEEIIYMANENDTEEIELLANSLDTSLVNVAEYSSRQDKAVFKTVSQESAEVAITTTSVSEGQRVMVAETTDTATGADTAETEGKVLKEEAPPVTTETEEEIPKPEAQVEVPPAKIFVEPTTPEPEVASEIISQAQTKGTRKEQLNTTIMNQASVNIQRLRELLEIVPESVRPAIEKAIEISERGYEIAIESLD